MIQPNIQTQIITVWEKYISDHKIVLDTKGNNLQDIDNKRISVIEKLKLILQSFYTGAIDLAEFKTEVDSCNKQNNLWGFTSVKGQMFFNLLFKTSEAAGKLEELTALIRQSIATPKDLSDALSKIDALERYCIEIFQKATDRRRAPNPGSTGYFLSYFWQIQDAPEWPVMYSSMIVSFTDIGLWQNPVTQKEAYASFYALNEEIKEILAQHIGRPVTNWEAEHAFWNFRTVTAYPKKADSAKVMPSKQQVAEPLPEKEEMTALDEASFDIYDYVPRVVENLVELGSDTEATAASKGSRYERLVGEIFKQLGFAVTQLGQGHREPDLIAVHKEENIAFIIDAKAYANGYTLSASDERAIREYINHHCPRLKKDGIQRIGFIIVSNSFKPGFDEFANDITWKTDIKRFMLLSSSALLHLLAYRIKDQRTLSEIVEAIISIGSSIRPQDIVQKFNDY